MCASCGKIGSAFGEDGEVGEADVNDEGDNGDPPLNPDDSALISTTVKIQVQRTGGIVSYSIVYHGTA